MGNIRLLRLRDVLRDSKRPYRGRVGLAIHQGDMASHTRPAVLVWDNVILAVVSSAKLDRLLCLVSIRQRVLIYYLLYYYVFYFVIS